MRVCKPGGCIRIYPIMSLQWEPYRFLDQLIEEIGQEWRNDRLFQDQASLYSRVGIWELL